LSKPVALKWMPHIQLPAPHRASALTSCSTRDVEAPGAKFGRRAGQQRVVRLRRNVAGAQAQARKRRRADAGADGKLGAQGLQDDAPALPFRLVRLGVGRSSGARICCWRGEV
jgi:hypothetical protein